MTRLFGAWRDPSELIAEGAARREKVPVEDLTRYAPPAGRPDPVALIEATNADRVPALIPLRHQRMAESPFTFLRGAAAVMATDIAEGPASGFVGHICGDAHASNFGLYASPERRQIMDVNDFDETVQGPWEWDLKRLVASLLVAARSNGLPDAAGRAAARDCATGYRAALAELAGMALFDGHCMTTSHETLEKIDMKDLVDTFDRVRKKARKNTSRRAAQRYAQRPGVDAWHFVADPPVLTHVPAAERAAVLAGLDAYGETLDEEMRWLLSRYTVADVAHRIVGLGSVGLRSYVVLLHGNGDEALILQVKQARPSAFARYVASGPASPGLRSAGSAATGATREGGAFSGPEARVRGASASGPAGADRHEGQRVVNGQRWMQTVSDVLLGWTSVDGRPYQVRQFRDMKGSIDPGLLKGGQLDDYARVVGVVLARAHGQSIDPRVLHGYCDAGGEQFDRAFERFAVAYADQTEADHARFVASLG
jgi:uncharacterized protein (DUF2252 family)